MGNIGLYDISEIEKEESEMLRIFSSEHVSIKTQIDKLSY
jgi:hypothetical protein